MTAANGCDRAIDETTSLGMAILIAESEDGAYQPIGSVDTIREAREMAHSDMQARMRRRQVA